MKSKFCFVKQLGKFKADDVVYRVWIGTSRKELILRNCVAEYCKDAGWYFRPWDEKADLAINSLAVGLFPGSKLSRLYLLTADISISELFQMIVDDSFGCYEKSLVCKPQWSQTLSLLSPSFRIHNFTKICNTPRQPKIRKYLSRWREDDHFKAVISAWLILAMFLTSAWLESIERSLF